MLKGKLDLLSNTNMVDFAMDVYSSLYPDQEVPTSKSACLKLIHFMCNVVSLTKKQKLMIHSEVTIKISKEIPFVIHLSIA